MKGVCAIRTTGLLRSSCWISVFERLALRPGSRVLVYPGAIIPSEELQSSPRPPPHPFFVCIDGSHGLYVNVQPGKPRVKDWEHNIILEGCSDELVPLALLRCLLTGLEVHYGAQLSLPTLTPRWALRDDTSEDVRRAFNRLVTLPNRRFLSPSIAPATVTDHGVEYTAAGRLISSVAGCDVYGYYKYGHPWIQLSPENSTVKANKRVAGTPSFTLPLPAECDAFPHQLRAAYKELMASENSSIALLANLGLASLGPKENRIERRVLALFEASTTAPDAQDVVLLLFTLVKSLEPQSIFTLLPKVQLDLYQSLDREGITRLWLALVEFELRRNQAIALRSETVSGEQGLDLADCKYQLNLLAILINLTRTEELRKLLKPTQWLVKNAYRTILEQPVEDVVEPSTLPKLPLVQHISDIVGPTSLDEQKRELDLALPQLVQSPVADAFKRAFCEEDFAKAVQCLHAVCTTDLEHAILNKIQRHKPEWAKADADRYDDMWADARRHAKATAAELQDRIKSQEVLLQLIACNEMQGYVTYLTPRQHAHFSSILSHIDHESPALEQARNYFALENYSLSLAELEIHVMNQPTRHNYCQMLDAYELVWNQRTRSAMMTALFNAAGLEGPHEEQTGGRGVRSVLHKWERHVKDPVLLSRVIALRRVLEMTTLSERISPRNEFESTLLQLVGQCESEFTLVDDGALSKHCEAWYQMSAAEYSELMKTFKAELSERLLQHGATKESPSSKKSHSCFKTLQACHSLNIDRYPRFNEWLNEYIQEEKYLEVTGGDLRPTTHHPHPYCPMRQSGLGLHLCNPLREWTENGVTMIVRRRGFEHHLLSVWDSQTKTLLAAVVYSASPPFVFDRNTNQIVIPPQYGTFFEHKLRAISNLARSRGTAATVDEWRDVAMSICLEDSSSHWSNDQPSAKRVR